MPIPPFARSAYRFVLLLFALTVLLISAPHRTALALPPGKTWVEKATAASPVAGQKRLALIVGNTHYGGAHDLKNPENDAKAVAAALGKLGFTSVILLDGSREQMRDAVHGFADRIRAAGDGAVALLYYSGHGMQVDGENYLIPVGFKMPTRHEDIAEYALSAQKALDEMQGAKARVNIAVLDACRDNPFEGSRSLGGRGLAKLEAQGMLIAYATAAGRTADDNAAGGNGLYTAFLLKFLQTPGLRLYDVFKSTNKAVYDASKHEQFPYLYDGLIDDGDFYLLPGTAAVPNPEPVVTTADTRVVDTKARLTVTTNVPGAVVTVDGKTAADGSFAMNLLKTTEKRVAVGVTADGYEGKLVTVKLTRGRTVTLPVVLTALPPPEATADTTVSPAPARPLAPPLTLAEYKARMIGIPPGKFAMGSEGGNKEERPARKVSLSAYRIGRTDVTVAMFGEFCAATKRAMPKDPDFNRGWARKGDPIVNVSWDDARAFCKWAGLKLPTEAQWERAARGTDGRKYPWGTKFNESSLWWSKAKAGNAGGTHVVGEFPGGASPCGCLDMAGNVSQWCEDVYDEGFYASRGGADTDPVNETVVEKHAPRTNMWHRYSVGEIRDGFKRNKTGGVRRVVRGGSWTDSKPDAFRTAARDSEAVTTHSDSIGFRAVSL